MDTGLLDQWQDLGCCSASGAGKPSLAVEVERAGRRRADQQLTFGKSVVPGQSKHSTLMLELLRGSRKVL